MPPVKASHYIIRPGVVRALPYGGTGQAPGRLVPLIAVDQLPAWLEISGVPRELQPEDAVGMIAVAGYEHFEKDKATKVDADNGVFDVRMTHWNTVGKEVKKERGSASHSLECEKENAPSTPTTATPEMASTPTSILSPLSSPSPPPSSVSTTTHRLTTHVDNATDPQGPKTAEEQTNSASVKEDTSNNCFPSQGPILVDVGFEDDPSCAEDDTMGVGQASEMDAVCWPGGKFHGDENNFVGQAEVGAYTKSVDNSVNNPFFVTQSTTKKSCPPQKKAWIRTKPCKYWCRTGYCNYGDKCKFKHIMPTTAEGLREVDLDYIPDWWTKGVKSPINGKTDSDRDANRGGSGSGSGSGKAKSPHLKSSSLKRDVPPWNAMDRNKTGSASGSGSNKQSETATKGRGLLVNDKKQSAKPPRTVPAPHERIRDTLSKSVKPSDADAIAMGAAGASKSLFRSDVTDDTDLLEL